eukprot:CAMPEP_0171697472 /NCGR_PEP_ID=MMETSP0991-20121206/8836_1 /TAXON_ID=483369 /ORGANISM="non described non described, Strain CCMP2098" /LENGTH=183 /DNA_ID=CAMNT_0012286261 /DNA_START=1539 /DNA_END=2087 /DNA_ORIENTATION=+
MPTIPTSIPPNSCAALSASLANRLLFANPPKDKWELMITQTRTELRGSYDPMGSFVVPALTEEHIECAGFWTVHTNAEHHKFYNDLLNLGVPEPSTMRTIWTISSLSHCMILVCDDDGFHILDACLTGESSIIHIANKTVSPKTAWINIFRYASPAQPRQTHIQQPVVHTKLYQHAENEGTRT